MGKRIEFTKEQKYEIRIKICKAKKLKDIKSYNHILVLNMRRLGKTREEISEVTGYHVQYISDIIRKYINEGMESIIGNHYKSNNRRMSFEEETEFLEQFREEAEQGLLITVVDILKKYEKTGKESNTSTIYALLKRHGWRKVKPRPRHPNTSDEEERESSKKLTQNGSKSCWENITSM
jgi:transposase